MQLDRRHLELNCFVFGDDVSHVSPPTQSLAIYEHFDYYTLPRRVVNERRLGLLEGSEMIYQSASDDEQVCPSSYCVLCSILIHNPEPDPHAAVCPGNLGIKRGVLFTSGIPPSLSYKLTGEKLLLTGEALADRRAGHERG